jgi:diguanylate cyclase (GGDEF)-like protein
VFTFPLRHQDGRLGALDLYREEPGELGQADLAAAQTLADVTAAYLLNAAAREEARATSDRFRLNALHDALTGLPNRVLLQQRLEHAGQRASRSHTLSAVLYADLDRFKRVNDTHGHGVGDEVLVGVASRLAGLVRSSDTLARVSGDEFVVLCADIESITYIERLADRICAAFDRPFTTSAGNLMMTASVGIAFAGPDEPIADQLVVNADIAMYQAKRNGGARYQIIDLRQADQTVADDELADAFRAAFAGHKLAVAYQPIVRSYDGAVIAVEALVRWTHPERGPMSAMSAIAVAERTGLINDLGAWVLERGARDHAAWMAAVRTGPVDLAVNVSANQLVAPGFLASLDAVLARTGLDPARLIMEMTESIYIAEAERATGVLTQLRAKGIRLALDHFGLGYASLTYLRRIPVDIIKIDQTFTADIGRDRVGGAMIASLVRLAHTLDLSVTIEGVETREQHEAVLAMGPEAAQGYHYGPPMSADAIAAVLRGRPSSASTTAGATVVSLRSR